jgi:hypothetical protein
MTLNAHKALEQYFHQIVNKPPVKEPTMFDKTKLFFTQQIERFAEKINSLLTKPTAFVEEPANALENDYWAFEMYTGEWYSDDRDELIPVKHTCIIEPHDSTWMEILDKVIDELEKHYGYSIKEQVYYSVAFPQNEPLHGEFLAGYGRSLNDTVLQQLLLAYPEVYQTFVPTYYTITGGAK